VLSKRDPLASVDYISPDEGIAKSNKSIYDVRHATCDARGRKPRGGLGTWPEAFRILKDAGSFNVKEPGNNSDASHITVKIMMTQGDKEITSNRA
jgi:hypothetical protein